MSLPRAKGLLSLLLIFPSLVLAYYGISLYVLTEKEADKSLQIRHRLQAEFPRWSALVDQYVASGDGHWISPEEAGHLLSAQKTLQEQSLYLSVDSLITRKQLSADSLVYVYDYSSGKILEKTMPRGAALRDAKYIVNNRTGFIGLTHDQTGYLLMLQTALNILDQQNIPAGSPAFFNGNFAINDLIINERSSMVAYDRSGKYLIQLSSRLPDAGYVSDNNRVVVSQPVYGLFRNFVRNAWLIPLVALMTLLLYRRSQQLSRRNEGLLNCLNKATCAILICDRDGHLRYANNTFWAWNKNQANGATHIRSLIPHPQMDDMIRDVLEHPGTTRYYYAKIGSKNVHTGLSYDSESNALIVVDTDVSALRNMYDGELHSLKNLMLEVKELMAKVIVGDADIHDTVTLRSTLQYSHLALEKALLLYENQRYSFDVSSSEAEMNRYDLELGLEYIINWFRALLEPLQIRVEVEVKDFEVRGHIGAIELIFHNALFNAIQAIREHENLAGAALIRITASSAGAGKVLVEISDNGAPLPVQANFEALMERTNGNGLQIIQTQMLRLGGECLGIVEHNGFKTLKLNFLAA